MENEKLRSCTNCGRPTPHLSRILKSGPQPPHWQGDPLCCSCEMKEMEESQELRSESKVNKLLSLCNEMIDVLKS